MEKLDLDLSQLSESEKQAIFKVLKRDEDLRKKDEQRINRLKSELQWLRRRGAIKTGSDPMNSCSRCRCELGRIINRGAPCTICRGKICKSCRYYIKDGLEWICIVCHKQLEIEVATGEWMNEFVRRTSKKKDKKSFVPPSDVVKALIVRNQVEDEQEEKEGIKSGLVNLRTQPSSKSMDYHPRQRQSRSPKESISNRAIISYDNINSLTSNSKPANISPSQLRHNQVISINSSTKSTRLPVPAPRTSSKKSLSDVVTEIVEEKSPSSSLSTVIKTPVISKQKRQAPKPPPSPNSSPSLKFKDQTREPPTPPPPYRSRNSCSGERSDSGISQDNQPSPKSSSQSACSARSTASRKEDNNSHEAESVTGGSVSSDLDSEVEPTSGVVFRKVAIRRKKKPAPKQRPVSDNGNGLVGVECGSSSGEADETSNNQAAQPHLLFSTFNILDSSFSRYNKNSKLARFTNNTLPFNHNTTFSSANCDRGSFQFDSPIVPISCGSDLVNCPSTLTKFNTLNFPNKPSTSSSERLWWPINQEDRNFGSHHPGLASGLSLSLSTVYQHHQPPYCCDLRELRSCWSADDANVKWNLGEKPTGATPTHSQVTWDDIRISSPELEFDDEDNYLIQSSNCNVTQAESLNDLSIISSNVLGKILPESEEYRIVFISSSSSSSNSSCLNDVSDDLDDSIELFDDDNDIKLSKINQLQFNEKFEPVVSAPDQSTLTNGSTSSFMIDHLYYDFPTDSDNADGSSEWKHAGVYILNEDESDVSERSSVYSFVRTDSIRSSGERSIGEQSFSNQVFACEDNLLTTGVDMSEHEVTLNVDDDEEEDQQNISFDSGTSVSDSEIAGGGYVEEPLDSSDDECVAFSYQVNADEIDDVTVSDECDVVLNFMSETSSVCDESEHQVTETNVDISVCDESEHQVIETNVDNNVCEIEANEIVSETDLMTNSDEVCKQENVKNDDNDSSSESLFENELEINDIVCGQASELTLSEQNFEQLDVKQENDLYEDFSDGVSELIVVPEQNLQEHDELLFESAENKTEVEDMLESVLQIPENVEHPLEKVEQSFENFEQSPEILEQPIETFEQSTENYEPTSENIEKFSEIFVQSTDNFEHATESVQLFSNNYEHISFPENVAEKSGNLSENVSLPIENADLLFVSPVENITKPTGIIEHYSDRVLSLCDSNEPLSEVNKPENADNLTNDSSKTTESTENAVSGDLNVPSVDVADEICLNPEEISSELDNTDTDSQDTIIEGETYRRIRQVAIREKLLLANREWETKDDDNSASDTQELNEEEEESQSSDIKTVEDVQTSVVSLNELVAKSRAMSASYKSADNDVVNVETSSPVEPSSSVLEKYFMSSLEHMAPLEWARNRHRQPNVKQSSDEVSANISELDSSILSDVSSERSSEDTSEAYDSDRRFDDSSTEGDETFDDDDSSSTFSTSSDEGSMYLGQVTSNETVLMCRQALDMSLHTIMEESCEESESEERRNKPTTAVRKSDPSELQRYFEFTFAGGPTINEIQSEQPSTSAVNFAISTAESLANSAVSTSYQHMLMPGDRLSRTDSELSYDTLSETESSIFSESENRDGGEIDDEELARLASSRLEKYFLTGLLGMNVGNYLDMSQDNILPDSGNNNHTLNRSKRSQSESSTEEEAEATSFDAFEKNDGCDTIKRIKRKENATQADQPSNQSLENEGTDKVSEPENATLVNENQETEKTAGKHASSAEVTPWNYSVDLERSSPPMGGVSRSLMALDWKQQSRDSGFIGSSDDLLQDGSSSERLLDEESQLTALNVDKKASKSTLETFAADIDSKMGNTNPEIAETVVASVLASPPQLPTSSTASTAATSNTTNSAFGLFRSSSRSTKSGRSLYASDDEAQYIVNQLVNHIAKSMSRSPQLARAKPPEVEQFESELTKLMQTVPAIEFTVKEIVEELSSTDHYSDSYESSDYTSSDQEGPMFPLQFSQLPNNSIARNDSGRSWRSYGSSISKSSSVDEFMPEETMFIYEKFMDSLTKMAEHMSEDAKSVASGSMDEKMSGKYSASSSGKNSPPTAMKIVQHIRTKLTTLMREVSIDRSPSIGSGRSSFHSNTRPTIMWNKPGSGSGSAAGDELSISSTTSSANFESDDSPTDTELSVDSDDHPMIANLTTTTSSVSTITNSSVTVSTTPANTLPTKSDIVAISIHKTSGTERPLSLMERTPTDDESEDGLERWSSDMTIVDDDIRFSSIHKSDPMLLSNSDAAMLSKTLPSGQSYGLSSHPNPTALRGVGNQGTNSYKSDWDMWKSVSKGSQVSGQRTLPTKFKSCDPLPSAKSSTVPKPSNTTPRDKKKHTFAFMLRQKSGSSSSLKDASVTHEASSIKQQIQFRSSLYLSNVKSKDETPSQPQPQQPQQRSSSMHWLFGRNKDSNKKGNVPVNVGGGWSSNPDGISRVGVDVTTAVGVDLSDSESSGQSGHSGSGSGGTTPRIKGHLSASQPISVNNDSSINDEHRSNISRYSMAPPQPRPRSGTIATVGIAEHSSSKTASPASGRIFPASKRDVNSMHLPSSRSSVVSGTESPDAFRDIHSWPVDTTNTNKMSNSGSHFSTPQRSSRFGPTLSPNSAYDDNSEKGSRLDGSSAGSHTGSSDPDNFPDEDIDRLVALHNRSLSSLGVCSESMSSVYSAAGGGHYGNVTVRGEVQFCLSYNYVNGALEVNIKQCRDLAAVDVKRNRSDPYVKVYLLPDKSKGGKRKTRVKKHTLNPSFNEVLKFFVTISELETRTLWLTVWHSDMFGRNEFLGEVTLPMGYEAWEDPSPKWYLLQEKLGSPEEVFSYKGDLVVALKYVPPEITSLKKGRISKGSLYVLVKEARNLMAVSTNGTSDPFCKCYLLPDKGKNSKQKTPVIKRSCNPKWNHTFVYEDLSLDDVKERCLELTVWDYDRLTSNDFLGGVRLSLGMDKYHGRKVDWMDSRGEEVALWQAMLEKPNQWVDGSVLLRPSMDHRQTN